MAVGPAQVDMVVQREKVKLDWVKSRFELIQARP